MTAEDLRLVFSRISVVLPPPGDAAGTSYAHGWEDCAENVLDRMRVILDETPKA